MKLYSENKNYKLYQGNMLDMLEVIKPESIDSIVTDPPYGLTSITKRFGKENSAECQYGKDGSFQRLSKGFMGKEWDGSGIEYNIDTWRKCYEVLKPGGYLLAFGGSRTFHRIACAIEDAGFEIRDTIMWIYGMGFPKSQNIGKQLEKRLEDEKTKQKTEHDLRFMWERDIQKTMRNEEEQNEVLQSSVQEQGLQGTMYGEKPIKRTQESREVIEYWNKFGTALKPSFEPIIVARKPFKGSLVDNVIEYGVGGINIDECRVEPTGEDIGRNNHKNPYGNDRTWSVSNTPPQNTTGRYEGRFPANTILTYDETDLDEVCWGFPNTKTGSIKPHKNKSDGVCNFNTQNETINYFNGDSGSASRYFYCAKASKKDRDEGLENFAATTDKAKGNGLDRVCEFCGVSQLTPELCHCEIKSWITKPRKNTHPTVKPTELMQYLVRLVTPNGATILDPFNGSGSTGKAVMYENKERNKNYKYIGIELTEEYLPIAKARIEYVCESNLQKEIKKEEINENQLTIFDI